MPEDSFLLINLKDSESKKLAQVISNESSRKILDYLSKKKSTTETDIANELNLPLSTVHYNLQALTKAKLVNADEFHYSKKGKEVIHYSLANKYIIIAPKASPKFLDSLKKIIPAFLIVGAAAGLMKLYEIFTRPGPGIFEGGARSLVAEEAAVDMLLAQEAAKSVEPLITNTFILNFLYGALFAIAIYLIIELFSRRVK
jgi:DNA-binding transcriptional ArsR family regulator